MPQSDDEESYCYSCDDTHDYSDLNRSEYDGEMRCDHCHEEHCEECDRSSHDDYGIYDYSYTPTLNFFNDSGNSSRWARKSTSSWMFDESFWEPALKINPSLTDLYLGPEIEVECVNGILGEGADWVYRHATERTVYLKYDGSLSHGFEIVGHPGTLGWYMEHFNWDALTGLSDLGFKSWNRRSCGLHVHLSRSAFVDEKHLFKFFYLFYKNSPQMIQFAGRESRFASFSIDEFLARYNGWGDRDYDSGYSFMKYAKNEAVNDNRYCAINLRRSNTIELRFFRPSLRRETVMAAFQMCDAAHRYTASLTTQDCVAGNALSFGNFRKWISSNPFDGRYEILDARINERVL